MPSFTSAWTRRSGREKKPTRSVYREERRSTSSLPPFAVSLLPSPLPFLLPRADSYSCFDSIYVSNVASDPHRIPSTNLALSVPRDVPPSRRRGRSDPSPLRRLEGEGSPRERRGVLLRDVGTQEGCFRVDEGDQEGSSRSGEEVCQREGPLHRR